MFAIVLTVATSSVFKFHSSTHQWLSRLKCQNIFVDPRGERVEEEFYSATGLSLSPVRHSRWLLSFSRDKTEKTSCIILQFHEECLRWNDPLSSFTEVRETFLCNLQFIQSPATSTLVQVLQYDHFHVSSIMCLPHVQLSMGILSFLSLGARIYSLELFFTLLFPHSIHCHLCNVTFLITFFIASFPAALCSREGEREHSFPSPLCRCGRLVLKCNTWSSLVFEILFITVNRVLFFEALFTLSCVDTINLWEKEQNEWSNFMSDLTVTSLKALFLGVWHLFTHSLHLYWMLRLSLNMRWKEWESERVKNTLSVWEYLLRLRREMWYTRWKQSDCVEGKVKTSLHS